MAPYLALGLLPIWQQVRVVRPCPAAGGVPIQASRSMPDLHQLASSAESGGGASTPEQIAEEESVDLEQVETARQWLGDHDPAQRIAGAQQLAAYPTPEAGRYLLEALRQDRVGEVRAAAAESLGYFDQPALPVYDALIAALNDPDEAVRFNAFSALQTLMDKLVDQPRLLARLQAKLKQILKSKKLPADSRVAVEGYLQDQSP
ncbi:HEAT repeat domain-containing protein [Methylomonas sp. LWB]|uniref:HEAT repeat domain-containing protein n=1 Tax=Methylomonas sp. LWB TaxID=1905845 RepID=UPI0009F1966D|nr:HEAT repeat domain-containing protein [Methylomonas sp. LWB]